MIRFTHNSIAGYYDSLIGRYGECKPRGTVCCQIGLFGKSRQIRVICVIRDICQYSVLCDLRPPTSDLRLLGLRHPSVADIRPPRLRLLTSGLRQFALVFLALEPSPTSACRGVARRAKPGPPTSEALTSDLWSSDLRPLVLRPPTSEALTSGTSTSDLWSSDLWYFDLRPPRL